MTDMLRTGRAWLAGQMTSHLASQVVYRRGASSATINACFADADREVEDADGIRIGATMIDFLIAASAFEAAFGAGAEPANGDRIVADGRIYEVLDLAGQGLWRWSGAPGVAMRVHTKQVGVE